MTETGMTEAVIANVEMAAAWDGEEGDEGTEKAERYDATDRWIGTRFEALADIAQGDNVLDVGCGTGKVTRSAARCASSGSVFGIDLSSRMLEHARRQSEEEGLTNIRFAQGDAQVYPFEPASFDIAISSFGAMFFAAAWRDRLVLRPEPDPPGLRGIHRPDGSAARPLPPLLAHRRRQGRGLLCAIPLGVAVRARI